MSDFDIGALWRSSFDGDTFAILEDYPFLRFETNYADGWNFDRDEVVEIIGILQGWLNGST